jgi:SIR2-like domain
VSIRTHNPGQVHDLKEHLDDAAGLDENTVADLRALAGQLDERTVLPLIGAGGSFDCGMPLARDIGQELLRDYLADPLFAPHAAELGPDMADVSEAIYTTPGHSQLAVVQALGLPDPALWPDAAHIEPHFCAYRVLARLAREDLFAQAVSLNYDCGCEAALKAEGYLLAPASTPGARWRDHATLIADPQSDSSTARAGSLALRKLHGCAAHYRHQVGLGATDHPEDRIIARRAQLNNWRNDQWARDYLRGAARTSIMLLLGFSGQDPVIAGELTTLLSDIYQQTSTEGEPRVIAIDYNPDTATLRGLIRAGHGGGEPAVGAITQIKTQPATTTATLMVLLTETLHHHLHPHMTAGGYTPPDDLEGRIAALTLAAPAMLRWAYLLRQPEQDSFNQRTNLHAAASHGYVPLRADPATTVRALKTRAELRAMLGHTEPESTREALADDAFLTHPAVGIAYLPCGLDLDTLRGGARPGGELQMTRETLPWPKHLDCVLVAEGPAGPHGINLQSGHEVPVP